MTSDKSPSTDPSPGQSVEPASADPARRTNPTARPARKPEQTSDDTDVGWGETPESGDAHDRWLHEQRPPHWD